MPIYEYICRDCQHRFEVLVMGGRQPECPSCHGRGLEKQLSVFAVSAAGKSSADAVPGPGACGTCGDPRGPGSCRFD